MQGHAKIFESDNGECWPPRVPRTLLFLLMGTGTVDPRHVGSRRIYQGYRLCIACSMAVFVAYSALRLIDDVLDGGVTLQAGIAVEMLYLFAMVSVCMPLWRFGCRQLSAEGPMMDMIQQMDVQGYPWESVVRGLILTLTLAVPIGIALIGMGLQEAWTPRSSFGHAALVLAGPCVFAGPLVVVVTAGCIWLVWFSTRLHEYDLLCYAAALHCSLLADESDALPLLQQVEEAITARLRLASESWVGHVFRSATCCAVLCLLHICYLFSVDSSVLSAGSMLQLIIWTVASFCVALILVMPIAHVSETFQWDVLKALNTPLVVERSQKYFGQQFLMHVEGLDWGFRLGGRVLGLRVVFETGAAICTTVGAVVAQSVIRFLS